MVTRSGAVALVFTVTITITITVLAFFWHYSTTTEPPQCVEFCDEPRPGEDLPPPPRTRFGESLSFALILSIIVFFLSGLLATALFLPSPDNTTRAR